MSSRDSVAAPFPHRRTRFRQVCERLWQLEFLLPFTTNVWFVQEDDGLTVVDSGYWWNGRDVEAALAHLGLPMRRLVVTHAHPDHAGSAAVLAAKTGCEVLAHADDVPYLSGAKTLAHEKGWWGCHVTLGALYKLHILDPKPVASITPLQEGDQVGRLTVLHTPGHTPGSLSLWDEADEAMFVGDNVQFTFNFLHLGVPWYTLDVPRRNESMKRYLQYPVRRLCAGHGPVYQGDVCTDIGRLLPK